MAKVHHMVLKAAIAKYLPMVEENKTEEEIKAALAQDEKGYDEETIEQIYKALTAQDETQPGDEENKPELQGIHIVKSKFHDINDFGIVYHPGEDVSHFDEYRLKDLISKDLVEIQ